MVDLQKIWGVRLKNIVTAVSTSDDGQYTIAASKDRHVYMFDAKGQAFWTKKFEMAPSGVAMAPNGSFAVLTVNYDIFCYDLQGNIKWNQKAGGETKRCAITPDGKKIAVSCGDCHLYLYNESGVVLWRYKAEGQAVALAVNRDASVNVVGSTNGDMHILDGLGGLIKRRDFAFDVLCCAISGSGKVLLIGSYNKLVVIRLDKGTEDTFEVENWVRDVAMDQAPSNILVGSMGVVSFFDGDFAPVYNLSPTGWAHAIKITQDGRFVTVGYGDDHVDLYENRDYKRSRKADPNFKVTEDQWEDIVQRVAELEKALGKK